MSFRKANPYSVPVTRVERLLKRLLVEDWSLKLLALAIALVLWFLRSGRS
jgi:hypothetical protein